MILSSVSRQHVISFLLLAVIFVFSFVWYQLDFSPSKNDSKLWNRTAVTVMTETLCLVWNWPWGQSFSLDKCAQYGFSGCKLSSNRKLHSTADVVLIHHADIMWNPNDLPKQPRPFFQHWVWVNLEPPLIVKNLQIADNLFNATMTFREDSDIFIPYGRMHLRKEPENVTVPKKSKLVAWVVSKWYPGVPRIAYYEELKKHITIDVYGARHMPLSSKDFHPTISQYKFYLSFENSIYKDYITEKIWSNAFGSWAVPVVLGTSRKNYERYIPGDAFIHVDDFPSAKELANYLLELDKDDAKYQKYFNWRSKYYVNMDDGWSYFYCKACSTIKHNPRYHTVNKIAEWFLNDV